jgi:hypothetical protein
VGPLTRIAAAALVAAAVAVTAVLLLGHDAPLHGVRPARALTVRTSFDPPAVQFGDRVVAQVVVLADRGALDTSRLQVSEDVAPLTPLGPAHVTRTTRGRLLVVSYDLPTVCLSAGCLGQGATRELRFPAARADAPRRSGGSAHADAVWPVLRIGGRVTAADLAPARPPFRADTSLPAVSYRIAPGTLSLLLDVIAAVLAAAGAALAVWQAAVLLRRGRSQDLRSPLERALALVHEAESRPPEDRRRAVGFLARVLRRRDESLAQAAGDLAWSEPAPAPDELAALADRVGHEVGDA